MKEQDSERYYSEGLDNQNDAIRENEIAFNDKIFYISCGALVLSVTFLSDVFEISLLSYRFFLFLAWIFFSSSVILNIGSYLYCIIACRKQRREIRENLVKPGTHDDERLEENQRKIGNWCWRLSLWTAILFVIGLISFIIFVATNLK